MTKCFDTHLGLCFCAGGIARFPSVDVVLPLEDFRDGVFDGAGLLKGKEVFAVAKYICLPATIADRPLFQVHVDLLRLCPNHGLHQPDDVVRGEGEAVAVLEEDPGPQFTRKKNCNKNL